MKPNIPKAGRGWVFHFAGLGVFTVFLLHGGYLGESHELRRSALGAVWVLSLILFADWFRSRHIDKRAQGTNGVRELKK